MILQNLQIKTLQVIIIIITFFLLLATIVIGVQTWRVNHYQSEYLLLQSERKTEIAETNAAIERAKANAAIQEKFWSDQLLKAEQNYNVKLKEITADAASAQSAANSMSKQLSEANKRLSNAPRETIIEYTITNSDILENCITEYREMAEIADGHAIDVRRLSESWVIYGPTK